MVRRQMVLGGSKKIAGGVTSETGKTEAARMAAGSSRQHLFAGPYKGGWNRNLSKRRW